MSRLAQSIAIALSLPSAARADNVFDVCKGESKTIVSGAGQMSIAPIYPDDFAGRAARGVRGPIGVRLAIAEKAKILLCAEVDKAIQLVRDRHWSEKANACTSAPSLAAVLGQKHATLSTDHVSIQCDDKNKCALVVDLERHGRPTAARWVRYTAPLADKP